MDPIKHISFDCWRTVLAPNPEFSIARAEYLSNQLGNGISPEDIESAIKFAGNFSDRIEKILLGSFTPLARLVIALDKMGLSIPKSRSQELLLGIDRIASLHHRPILIDPDFPEFLASIRSHNITTSISCNTGNISGWILRNFFEDCGLRFDFFVFSDQVGCVKPSQEFFKIVHHQAKCAPNEILHIGDDLNADFSGSQIYGMRSLLIEPGKINYAAINNAVFRNSHSLKI